ncbi:type II toxin-antitoxin system PemK/MazF family toxin [Microcoleus sp. S13_C5]|uniref:type II toxin-antitoxin system PemK/MazF family toxin n=1 Tax=Microcoleus sp. S13_C5 TaxID=3055411 RepID=UPI00403F2992
MGYHFRGWFRITSAKPSRGDIWLIDLNPTRGREQAGKRPCLVTSVDLLTQGASD